jgi:chromosome segregation protein
VLGKVNPLALEEYAALEERSAFLTTQLEDLKDTRRDLLTVVRDVDERIHEVFASAFEDTAREFVHVFATLFPGGEGRLVLTDPTTCSPPASRCWPGRPARRCPGCRCCPAASAR